MSSKQKGSTKKKRKLKVGKIILLIFEVFLLVGVGILLLGVLKTTGDSGITKYEINDAQANSDVKEHFEKDENLQQYCKNTVDFP